MILPVWEHAFPEWLVRAAQPGPREPDFLGSGLSVWDLYDLGHAGAVRVHDERYPDIPLDRRDLVYGSSALITMYVIQGGMVYFGPPWMKAAALTWILTPMLDPMMFGFGISIGNRWFD